MIRRHLVHLRGAFSAAGWRIHAAPEPPPGGVLGSAGLAVIEDPWIEALPELAEALIRARLETTGPDSGLTPAWRVPRVRGLEGEQGWSPRGGPHTLREYRRRAFAPGQARGVPRARSIIEPPWTGFAAARPEEAAVLLEEGWPPAAERVVLVPAARFYRYDDPADHERRELDATIPGGAKTLIDVGCGHGRLGERLRRERPGLRVIGIEPDAGMATEAEKRLDRVIHQNAEAGLAELSAPVDCVIFADVLEHLIDPAAALAAAAELLAPEVGRIVVSLPNAAWAPVLHSLAAGRWDPTLAGVQARDHFAPFTLASFTDLAAECGLAVERAEPLPAPLPLRLRLWAWLAARTAGGDPAALTAPQWVVVLRSA